LLNGFLYLRGLEIAELKEEDMLWFDLIILCDEVFMPSEKLKNSFSLSK